MSTRRNRSAHVQHQRQRAGRRLGSSGVQQLTVQHSVVRNPGAQQQRQRVDSAPLDAGVPQLIGPYRTGRDPGAARLPLAARMRNTGASTRPLSSGCTGVQQLTTSCRIGRDSDTRGATTAGGVHALASASG